MQASEQSAAAFGTEKAAGISFSQFLRLVWTIAAKDLRSELRTKEAINASVAFSIVILVLFSFAFDPSSEQLQEFSGGLLWLVFSFAGALVLNRSFARATLGPFSRKSVGQLRAAAGGRVRFLAGLQPLL